MNDATTTEAGPAPRPGDQWTRAGTIGLILVRVIVPLWVLAGALFKITERSPKLLPSDFLHQVNTLGLDLYWVLAVLIAIEFIAVTIMLLVPKYARLMAIFMLGAFCLVLLNELRAGNFESCGCLGSASPPPWLMLCIDFALLMGVVAFKPHPLRLTSERTGWTMVTVLVFITSGVTFGLVLGDESPATIVKVADVDVYGDSTTEPAPAAGTAEPVTPEPVASSIPALPKYYLLDTDGWVGRNVRDIDLVQYVDGLADSVQEGQQYLIFYSRTCDHCQFLLELHFGFGSLVPTTLVAIPESKTGFATEGVLDNPCLDCRNLELPVGSDWIITPPVVLALENGVVQCAREAEESEAPECLIWH